MAGGDHCRIEESSKSGGGLAHGHVLPLLRYAGRRSGTGQTGTRESVIAPENLRHQAGYQRGCWTGKRSVEVLHEDEVGEAEDLGRDAKAWREMYESSRVSLQ